MRCRFECIRKYDTPDGAIVTLLPVPTLDQDAQTLFKHSPFGKLEIGNIRAAKAEMFKPGKQFTVDINEVP